MTTIALAPATFVHPLPALAAPARRRAMGSVPAILGLVLAVPAAVVMVLVASLIGPFVMFALPFMLLFGFAFGPLHAMVKGEL
jgi:hypothetical protein